MSKGSGESAQIKRTNSVKIEGLKKQDDAFEIKKVPSNPDMAPLAFAEDEKHQKKEESEKPSKKVKTSDLKKTAQKLPVAIPAKKTVKTKASKPKTEKEKAIDAAKAEIERLHKELNAEEKEIYKLEPAAYNAINRNYYAGLSESDIKKRAQNAVKRREYARIIARSEASRRDLRPAHIDRETLKEKIALFRSMRSEPYDMDNDEKFVANLDKNYQLCQAAEHMKYWIDEASEAGFMPEGEDMAALQEKIEGLLEIKRYLNTQSALMKNEYYQYMAKDDISYTDDEIDTIISRTKNESLKDYLTGVQNLRSLHFKRRKGMKSSAAHSRTEGRRQAEILSTRAEKREMTEKWADKALSIAGNKRFTDKDYDARFTPKLFEETLARFKAMKISDLHFGSIHDIIDHYDDNQYMFDQAHDLEHLLLVAIQRGLAPADDQLIELRAKITAFTQAERMVSHMQFKILSESDKFINEQTYKDFTDDIFSKVSETKSDPDCILPPKVGCDMDKYLKTITRRFKQEHKDREKTITILYGLTHPVKAGKKLAPGVISGEELERRKADFQKTAFQTQYMRNLEVYIQNIYGEHLSSVARAHAKRTGGKVFNGFGRTLTPYLTGKSSQEIIRVIDICQKGSKKEKEELWTQISKEAHGVDYSSLDNRDPKSFYRNAAARSRMAKIIANLGGSSSEVTSYLQDKAVIAQNEALYTVGTGFDYSSSVSQASRSHYNDALEYADWFTTDGMTMKQMFNQIEAENEDSRVMQFTIGDRDYSMPYHAFDLLQKSLDRISFIQQSASSQRNAERVRKGIADNATVNLYDELKAHKVIKDATPEELTRITAFYRDYFKKDDEKNKALMKKVEDEVAKTDPRYKNRQKERTWILSDMALLNKYTEQEEGTRCAALYKGLVINGNKSKQQDAQARQERAEAIEDVFRTIMSFDINRFDFNSYTDIISDPQRFAECQAVTRLAADIDKYISDYRALRMDEEVKTLLRNVHVDEIQARCDLLMGAGVFFDERFADLMSSDIPSKIGKSFGDVMHLTPTEMREYLSAAQKSKPADMEAVSFWTEVMSFSQILNGFDLGSPLAKTEHSARFKRGLYERSRATEALNILNKTEPLLQDAEIGKVSFISTKESAVIEGYAEAFAEKDYTVSERESKQFNKKSRLYTKRLLAEKIRTQSRNTADDVYFLKRKISLKNRIALGEAGLDSLSPFLEDDTEANDNLAEMYADKNKRFEALDLITLQLMEMNLDFNANTDDEFARESGKMELISRRATAYSALLKANPEYEKRLMNRVPGNSLSDLERVTRRLDNMLAISDYYRARKTLMTDSYYVLHYNDEMSSNRDTATTDDQRRVADLINLVAQCSRRLGQNEYRSREDADMERVLSRAEDMSRRAAYTTGRPDLTKAEPDTVHKHNKEIERYLAATGLGVNTPKTKLAEIDLKKTYPKAEKYRTKAVNAYLDAVKTQAKQTMPGRFADLMLSPEKKELYDKLHDIFKDRNGNPVDYPAFHDTETGETWRFNTDIQRLPFAIANVYSDNMSNEEVLDVFEGLLIQHRTDINMKDKAQRQYARDRFLNSLQKIFRMQYDALKRYESTYGTLADDLPFGCFMESMGAGQSQFIQRNMGGQDFSQMVCPIDRERTSVSEGKNLTPGELLLKYGMISREELDDAIKLCPGYYQLQNADQNNRFYDLRDYDKNMPLDGHMDAKEADDRLYHRDRHTIKGPKISQTESRNIWKNALKHTDDKNLIGSKSFLLFQKNKLDLYTPAQKKELKAQRKKDAGLISFYSAYLEERREVLAAKTRKALNLGEDDHGYDELIGKLTAFHPEMLDPGNDEQMAVSAAKNSNKYYELIRQFIGIGITDDKEKAKAKKEAFTGLLKLWGETFKYRSLANDLEDMMTGSTGSYDDGSPREEPDEIAAHSKLFPSEVRHMMYDVVKEISTDRAFVESLDDKTRKSLDGYVRQQFSQEILRSLARHSFYLNLKDVGSGRQSYSEKMYQELSKQVRYLATETADLKRAMSEEDFRNALEYFGISTEGVLVYSETKITLPEKEEKKPAGAEKTEEKKAEAKKTEGAKTEVKKTEEKPAEAKHTEADTTEVNKHAAQKSDKINADEEVAVQIQQQLHYELPPVQYAANVTAPEKGVHTRYEKQGDGAYCWACVMSGLMNSFAGKKVSSLKNIKDRPLAIPSFAESGVKDQATYNAGRNLVTAMYEGNEYGNPAIFGDYIQSKLPNAAVRSAIVSREEGRLEYCKRRFLETLSKNLEKGPIGMLTGGHFVLVRELRGDTLMVNDSMSNDPDTLSAYHSTVSQLFEHSGQQVELVWLEDMTNREQELADQFDLSFNAEAKTFSFKNDPRVAANAPGQADYKEVKNEQTILQKDGIEASAQLYDDVVFNFIYLPKQIKEAQPGAGAQAGAGEQQARQEQKKEEKQTKEVKKTEEKKPAAKKTAEKKPAAKKTAEKQPASTVFNSKDEFAEFGYRDDGFVNPGMDLDFGDIEAIEKDGKDDLLEMEITDRTEENWVERNQDFLELDDLLTEMAYVENKEEARDRLAAERMHELNLRVKEPGVKVPDGLYSLAVLEKGKKGSFSKDFKESAAPFINEMEKIGIQLRKENAIIRDMDMSSIVELMSVGGRSLIDYVQNTYKYDGNDINVLQYYAAKIVLSREAPLVIMIPQERDGKLEYEPRLIAMDVSSGEKTVDEDKLEFRKSGIRAEQNLRGNAVFQVAEKAGRTYRQKNKADTFGFAGLESLSDNIKAVKPGSDQTYNRFVTVFNQYYQAVERFAYIPMDQALYSRLFSYLREARELASAYMRGKKLPKQKAKYSDSEKRHLIGREAVEELTKQSRILNYALDKGILSKEGNFATFAQVFKSYGAVAGNKK